ncbi:MAG: hypothetical protein C4288_20210 [Leptolyngbya sp. ERB_1_1]
MYVADLDHLEVLSNSTTISGGQATPNMLTLSLRNGNLLLSLAGTPLYQTALTPTPTGYSISLDNMPGADVSVSRATTTGSPDSTSILGVLIEPGRTSTYAFASSGKLPG